VSEPSDDVADAGGNPAWREVTQLLGEDYLRTTAPPKLVEFARFVAEANEIGHDPAGPVREVQSLVGDRWSGLILPLLHFGPLRFSTIQKIVGIADQEPITRRMLSYKLRALERDGFVIRMVSADSPSRVDYSLTTLGEAFYPVFSQLIHWLKDHNGAIEAARRAFERHDTDVEPIDIDH
jgi:DNA-binding HxlR family transcriptional regulator